MWDARLKSGGHGTETQSCMKTKFQLLRKCNLIDSLCIMATQEKKILFNLKGRIPKNLIATQKTKSLQLHIHTE